MNKKKISRIELVWIHFRNELKAILTDSGALLILVGAMIIYPLLYSVGYLNETLTDVSVGVVDMDHSEYSRKYIQMLDATPELNVNALPISLSEAKELFMKGEINGALVIEKNFQKNILSGNQANVSVYADASYFLKYRNELLAASFTNAYFSKGVAVKQYMFEGKTFNEAKIASDPLTVQPHVLYNPAGGYGSFVMPGIILVIIQQTLLIGIGVLGGSFSESKASPFVLDRGNRIKEILPYLCGKAGAYLIITLLNVIYAVFIVHHWFAYPDKASFLEILMLLFPFVLAVIFLGIGLSTLFKHRESAIVFMVFLSPIALFLSGLSWPVSAMPQWLVAISKVLPSTNVLLAYLRLRIMGVGLSEMKPDVIRLYLQAAIYISLTLGYFYLRVYWKYRKERVSFPK